MITSIFTNSETGVAATIAQADDGLYDVLVVDTDTALTIERRNGFTTEGGAREYALRFVN